MKIFFVIFIIILIAGSYLAWHLNPADSEKGKTRLVWISDNSPVRREQIDLFNRRYPDLRLTLDPGNLVMEKIIVQSLAGIGPDVFDAAGLYVLDRFAESGVALDLTDLAPRYGFNPGRTWPSVAGYTRIAGRQYAFPSNVYANVIFYNKNLFDKFHVPYPPRDMTWDQFVALGRQLTRRSSDGRGYECFGAINIYWYELVLQAGGSIFSPDGLHCTLDSPQAVEAIQFYTDLTRKYHIMPSSEDEAAMGGEGGWGAGYLKWFGAGRLAMIRISRWGLITFRQFENLKGRLGVCHQPWKRKKVCLVGAKLIAVNKHTKNIDAAMKFMKFLTSDEFNRQVVRTADYLPPVPKYARSEEFLHDPAHPEENFNDIFIEAVERGVRPEISPFVSPTATLNIVTTQLDLVCSGSKSPPQACRDMTLAVNKLIYQNLRGYEKYRRIYQQVTGKIFSQTDPEWKNCQ